MPGSDAAVDKSYDLRFAPSARDDLARIADHLFRTYVHFGDTPAEAAARVRERLSRLRGFIRSLVDRPHQGTIRDDLRPGLRIVPDRHRAAVAFDVDGRMRTVTVLRIFFGGEDYDAVMRGMDGETGDAPRQRS